MGQSVLGKSTSTSKDKLVHHDLMLICLFGIFYKSNPRVRWWLGKVIPKMATPGFKCVNLAGKVRLAVHFHYDQHGWEA